MNYFKLVKKYMYLFILGVAVFAFFAVNIRMNIFSYNNFDFGKFDLGNMAQMLWNTQHGRFMYLTDYFGTNLPRWSMSHVDPILLLFLPIFMLFSHPLTLVFAQIFIVLMSSFVLYFICKHYRFSDFNALMVSLAFLCYPALGYLTAKTGFHGVTAAIPFFLLTYYTYELMYSQGTMSPKLKALFWLFLIITMTGKEQISLYVFLYGIFLLLFRVPDSDDKAIFKKTAIKISVLGITWFVLAFFVIIPMFASQRIEGYEKFAKSLEIGDTNVRDVGLDNYFLSRYDAFGTSYVEIIKNILLKPDLAIRIFFGGDKVENFHMTFAPMMYTSFLAPQILITAVPDLMMNYLTSAGGIGTAEIQNHRISMIIPVLFLATIMALNMLSGIKRRDKQIGHHIVTVLSIVLLVANIKYSFEFQNPVFMWVRGAVEKRLPSFIAHAKENTDLAYDQNLKIGDVYRLSPLENKDRECAQIVVGTIPDNASVSGPDYLGAHLSMRETYAIFPALYNEADYVIVDIFSRKISTILDLNPDLVNEVVNKVVRDPNYALEFLCGNIFVYKNVGAHDKTELLPIQERFSYPEKFSYEIYDGLTLVDYTIPTEVERGKTSDLSFAYLNKNNIDKYILFLSFINDKTGYMYQVANLPSFAIKTTADWREDHYYTEEIELVLPSYLEDGTYRVFIGMTNYVKTRSVYLGDINVK